MPIVWTARAREDLQAAIDYIAVDNPAAALDQLDAIERCVDHLSAHPRIGRRGRVKDTRELVVPGTPFIAVYREYQEWVQLLRLLHHAQQWNADQ